jgi:ribosomal protein S18 acetylase RimI-like enzyme
LNCERSQGVFAAECGWNTSFKAFIAGPLMVFARRQKPRERIWIAEANGSLAGCVGIVEATPDEAQLRWLLVAPDARRNGLGSRLLTNAVAFAREQRYARVSLWTEGSLKAAARLYERVGFEKIEAKAVWKWGSTVVEEKHLLLIH